MTTFYELGFERGVAAAREAVAAADPNWRVDDGEDGKVFVMPIADALAVIDALREKP